MARTWQRLIVGLLDIGLAALDTQLIAPAFPSRTTFVPPQQQRSSAAEALASLGEISGWAGTDGNLKSSDEKYVLLLHSANVTDWIIDEFELM